MASNLEDEIERLQVRVSTLKKQLHIQTSTLIASPSTQALLAPPLKARTLLTLPEDSNPFHEKLLDQSVAQDAHKQQCLYRTCAAITTFRVQDPDPHAVDAGAVLGIRIEVVSRAKFLRPYYVLLNRPYADAGSRYLRVHRHTVPPCIPLDGLAARHLPPPPPPRSGDDGESEGSSRKKQDLARFVRSLRREIVRYHHRLGVVADLRKAAGLGRNKKPVGDDPQPGQLADISSADSEAKQISIEWTDGRVGRLVMGNDGEVVQLVALGDKGRDREAVRDLLGEAVRVDELARRLAAVD
ncbi:Cenp-O kinetochore centromere component-domain-containing protein [Podospora didyma]|uniref:Cenp-O kinetochore centromere component-domain-containing protein n=1 Tax=Podospora didyma TaxID=330526 RepID=A0AAE0P493_9PEZI|nr:Cenp-O kinetochore centromere component-domain-containing protein [Podospora didyma]